ncbi:molybdate ABC transporter substrate-binding protein [Enemella sp. A6]|uniref:molybdate ABC transporter substrate-binding protein n=1 Tax=Enemella sp. A6 TaxID=3440152 RepID=UPI003EBCEEF8
MKKRPLFAALLAMLMLALAACSNGGGEGSDPGKDEGPRELTVFAAASLEPTFKELAKTFEAEHEGVKVQLNLAGSSDLVTQISEGAPADVLATANEKTMKTAEEYVNEPVLFATNSLVIAVNPGNPKGIKSLQDLTRDDVVTVVCAPQVPCGAATEKILEATGVDLKPASEESSVTDVLGKVASGQADAGLVYTTDISRAEVEAVKFPEADDAINKYPIAVVKDSSHAELAQAWVDLVTGEEGQRVLGEAGFDKP